jgi:hypothetical protein
MANRAERRAQRRPGRPAPRDPRRQIRYRMLVLLAVVGLMLLAVASAGLVSSSPLPS